MRKACIGVRGRRARRTPEEMRWKLSVQFQGEEGIDAGGVTREWYQARAPACLPYPNPFLTLSICLQCAL